MLLPVAWAAEPPTPAVTRWEPPAGSQAAPRPDDPDRDGVIDAVLPGFGPLAVGLYLRGDLVAVRAIYEGNGFGRRARLAGDLTGDGWGDVLVDLPAPRSGAVPGSAWVIEGGPAPDPWRHLRLDAPDADRSFPNALRVVGDLDGDGRADLAFPSEARRQLLVWFGGALDAPGGVIELGERPAGLTAAGDLDGDGRADLLFGVNPREGREQAWLLHGGTPPRLDPVRGPFGRRAGGSREPSGVADLDGDGRSELLSLWDPKISVNRRLDVLRPWPLGWLRVASWEIGNCRPRVLAVDLDGRRGDELVYGCPDEAHQGAVFVVGRHFEPHRLPSPPGGQFGVALAAAGDVDHDGHPDLLVAGATYAVLVGDPLGAATVLRRWEAD